jgi:uncharacterized protein Yka (UPF0111/DUF47 family)
MNGFGESQIHQRTDSLPSNTRQGTYMWKHRLVSELIRCTTQPHERTDSLKHKLVSELIRSTTQPDQRTDSLKHILVIELLR